MVTPGGMFLTSDPTPEILLSSALCIQRHSNNNQEHLLAAVNAATRIRNRARTLTLSSLSEIPSRLNQGPTSDSSHICCCVNRRASLFFCHWVWERVGEEQWEVPFFTRAEIIKRDMEQRRTLMHNMRQGIAFALEPSSLRCQCPWLPERTQTGLSLSTLVME